MPTDKSLGVSIAPTTTGAATASSPSATAPASESDQRPTTIANSKASNINGSWLPDR